MPNQFENPKTVKVEEETVSLPTPEQKIEHVADKAAGKAAKTVKHYDTDHTIFSN